MKRFLALLSLVVLCFALAGCGQTSNPSQKELAMMGDDTLLAAEVDSYTNGPTVDQSNGKITAKAKDFTGSYTLWSETLEAGDVLEVNTDITLRDGELRLVLVYPDGQCMALWHSEGLTANGEHQVFIEEAGRYRLKIAGVHAKADVKLALVVEQ